MKKTFCSYWNKRWKGLDVGHRGSGTSFKPTSGDDVIRENTIASLRRAIEAGADMVSVSMKIVNFCNFLTGFNHNKNQYYNLLFYLYLFRWNLMFN